MNIESFRRHPKVVAGVFSLLTIGSSGCDKSQPAPTTQLAAAAGTPTPTPEIRATATVAAIATPGVTPSPKPTDQECVDPSGNKNGVFQIVGKQVEYFDLTGRIGIFDKGKEGQPLDPYLLRPALGGIMKIYPPEKKNGSKIDPNIKEIVSGDFTTTEPKIPNVKLTDSGKNLAWAYLKWSAPYNTKKALPDTRVLCAYQGWLMTTQDEANLVPITVAGTGVVPYWFGRRRLDAEGFIKDAATGIGRDMPKDLDDIKKAVSRK